MEAQKKVMTGIVKSDKMDKTIVVEVSDRTQAAVFAIRNNIVKIF